MRRNRSFGLIIALLFQILGLCNSLNTRIPAFPSKPQSKNPNFRALLSNDWEEHFFTQNVDHFSFTNTSYSSYQQKYLTLSKFWRDHDAPIFVYCGNEGPIEWFVENAGFLEELAEDFGALLVAPEVSDHIFYL